MVRLRFAPSPTGFLHIGGLRTALFSWLFTKKNKGSFIFRLEDTDRNRLVEEAEENLIRMLDWAGIDIDEGPGIGGDYGPYRQSERLQLYREHVDLLLEQGDAYPCFCTEERLEQLKTNQRSQGETPQYDNHCRKLNKEEILSRIQSQEAHVIRMKIPEKEETFRLKDLVRGTVAIESGQIEDQVILKSDGFPTYHLAVVIDDHLMQISHVVRGEEWLPSFPKHLLLYRYLGWETPEFVHLPLILNEERAKLSKRHGAVSVEDFRSRGYLPEALLNFIALLGWNPGDDRELLSLKELTQEFSFERVSKSGSIFDREKLNWMNQQYLLKLPEEEYLRRIWEVVQEGAYRNQEQEKIQQAAEILKTRLVTLSDFNQKLGLFFDQYPELNDPQALEVLKQEESKTVLREFLVQSESLSELTSDNLGQLVKSVQKTTGIKGRGLWMPLRCAITREASGPELAVMLDFFGGEKCLRLIRQTLELPSIMNGP
ncbi:MAG: glutamate--tRNA ligase [SAR324 cluster bacterium]|nr:glutamate--tRNA ligase [SAR324 cluster bacterium]